jgi:hydroxypyruvate isomerase
MNYSVCIDSVFQGDAVAQALKTVKDLGISSFEFWSWWDKDLEEMARLKSEYGMNAVTFCTKFISLTDSSNRDEYIAGLKESIEAAKKLDCNMLITQVGNRLEGISDKKQHESIVEGLKACTQWLKASGVVLLVEPLNTVKDHIGYYLNDPEEAFEIVREVASPNVKVLYDLYHQSMMGNLDLQSIAENIDIIGHFHAAGTPLRNEISKGDTDYKSILPFIYQTGYDGYIGLEYFPDEDAENGLKESKAII